MPFYQPVESESFILETAILRVLCTYRRPHGVTIPALRIGLIGHDLEPPPAQVRSCVEKLEQRRFTESQSRRPDELSLWQITAAGRRELRRRNAAPPPDDE